MAFGNIVSLGNGADIDEGVVVDGGINQYAQSVIGMLGQIHGWLFRYFYYMSKA